MSENGVTFERVIQLYEKSPDKLREIASCVVVRNPSQEEFKKILLDALQPSSSITNPEITNRGVVNQQNI